MEIADRITLNSDSWAALYRNLTAPSAEYVRSFGDYVSRIAQSIDIEETEEGTAIRSDRIDFDRLLAILDGESIEKCTVEDHAFVSADIEWIKQGERAPFRSGSIQRNKEYFFGSGNYLTAA